MSAPIFLYTDFGSADLYVGQVKAVLHAQAISLLGLRDLVPLVDNVFREDRIPEEWIDRPQFDDDLAEAERAPDDIDRFTQNNLGYIEDVLVSLDWTRGTEDAVDEEALWTDLAYPNEPVRNPWRHVGRNDPCPCGSGKKYKQCCGKI